MKKKEFIDLILFARKILDSVLSDLSREQMELDRIDKTWTAKDIIAHIDWYETEMVNVLSQHKLEGSDLWNLSLDERNEAIFLAFKDDNLGSIIDKEARTFQRMLELLENLKESDLNDPAMFKGMPADWQPWSVIASNTYEHYQDHIDQLKELKPKVMNQGMNRERNPKTG